MKSVLISIQPRWCHRIIDGEKTIEVRKSKPKLATPFKVYIYCSAGSYEWRKSIWSTAYFTPSDECENMSQMVIGEFVCDRVDIVASIRTPCMDYITVNDKSDTHFSDISCLNVDELGKYLGFNKDGYGWHISDLKIYDKPKELSEFASFCMVDEKRCASCEHYLFDSDDVNGYRRWCGVYRRKPLTHPPQSWCYVEELPWEK